MNLAKQRNKAWEKVRKHNKKIQDNETKRLQKLGLIRTPEGYKEIGFNNVTQVTIASAIGFIFGALLAIFVIMFQ